MSDPHHARLLLAILHQDWDSAERLTDESFDPERFLHVARACDVHPWVHARLAAAGRLQRLGPRVGDQLESWRTKVRQDNLLLLARAEQALDLLRAEGIELIALKGLDTLHRFYDRFDERTLDDVDLLVRRRDVGRTLEVLGRAGWTEPPDEQREHYLRGSHHLPLPGPGPVVVDFEIHWNLVQAGRYRLNPDDLFERAVPLDVAGRRILRLEDHDFAAHLLLHHFTHYFDRRLKWCIDLRFVVERPGFDWDAVAGRVREWGATAAVAMSVAHLAKLFPRLLTAGVRRRFPLGWPRRLATAPLRSRHPLDLFRGTRSRRVQLYLAAALLENPLHLPGWMHHRWTRDRREELSPIAADSPDGDSAGTEKRT